MPRLALQSLARHAISLSYPTRQVASADLGHIAHDIVSDDDELAEYISGTHSGTAAAPAKRAGWALGGAAAGSSEQSELITSLAEKIAAKRTARAAAAAEHAAAGQEDEDSGDESDSGASSGSYSDASSDAGSVASAGAAEQPAGAETHADADGAAGVSQAKDRRRELVPTQPPPDPTFFDTEASAVLADSAASFGELHLSRPLLRAIADLGWTTPTPIQAKTIPLALAGRDICGSAVTGSGKTGAFLLPILERLLFRDKRASAIRVLCVLPTRELAAQVWQVASALGKRTDIQAALVVGGLSNKTQEQELRARPDIVVCTPGRMLDHVLNAQGIHLDDVDILVLDEADRLLEMGFAEEVTQLVQACPKGRQTLLFSATMTEKVDELAALSLRRPVRVSADPLFDLAQHLTQEFVRVRDEPDREPMFLALVTRSFRERVIVFCSRKRTAHRLAIVLGLHDVPAAELHGDLTQRQRLEALEAFRLEQVDVLVATDLAARGLDLPVVNAVVNYDMPKQLATYVHRVGRTARAGRTGVAVSLVAGSQRAMMRDIVRHAQANVLARSVPPDVVATLRDSIASYEQDITDILQQEYFEKQARAAEMEATRAANLMLYEDDIAARPKREWWASRAQQRAIDAAARAKALGDGTAHDHSEDDDEDRQASAKDRKAARNAEVRAAQKAAKAAAAKQPHRMTRAKRRRQKLLSEIRSDEKVAKSVMSAAEKSAKSGVEEVEQSTARAAAKAALAAVRALDGQKTRARKAKRAINQAAAVVRDTGGVVAFAADRAEEQAAAAAGKKRRRGTEPGGSMFDIDLAGGKGSKGARRAQYVGDAPTRVDAFARRPRAHEKPAPQQKPSAPGSKGHHAFKSKKKFKRR